MYKTHLEGLKRIYRNCITSKITSLKEAIIFCQRGRDYSRKVINQAMTFIGGNTTHFSGGSRPLDKGRGQSSRPWDEGGGRLQKMYTVAGPFPGSATAFNAESCPHFALKPQPSKMQIPDQKSQLVVYSWYHGGHVYWQEKHFSDGNFKTLRNVCTVLSANMVALSRVVANATMMAELQAKGLCFTTPQT